MEQVTVTRQVDAPPAAVEEALGDLRWLMEAADFTAVTVERDGDHDRARPGDVVTVENRVGFATLSLTVEVVEDAGAALAYRQRDGIFSEMETRYLVEPVAGDGEDDASEVTAVTEFSLGKGVVGSALDATLVARQRRSELTAQLDALAERLGPDG